MEDGGGHQDGGHQDGGGYQVVQIGKSDGCDSDGALQLKCVMSLQSLKLGG